MSYVDQTNWEARSTPTIPLDQHSSFETVLFKNKFEKRSPDQCAFWWVFWFEAACALACAHLLFLHEGQLTVPLITSRSSKENNDSLFPCRNEGLNDFLVTLCLTKFDLLQMNWPHIGYCRVADRDTCYYSEERFVISMSLKCHSTEKTKL